MPVRDDTTATSSLQSTTDSTINIKWRCRRYVHLQWHGHELVGWFFDTYPCECLIWWVVLCWAKTIWNYHLLAWMMVMHLLEDIVKKLCGCHGLRRLKAVTSLPFLGLLEQQFGVVRRINGRTVRIGACNRPLAYKLAGVSGELFASKLVQ